MKSVLTPIAAILCVSLLSACSPQAAPVAPSPTVSAAPTAEPAQPTPTTPPPTEVPSVATITSDIASCTYDGPQTLPASDSFTVTWHINVKSEDIYALTPLMTDQQWDPAELKKALHGLDIKRPALPAGLTAVGTVTTLPRGTMHVTVKAPSGPLHGLLYFSCWSAGGGAFEVLGPFELK